MPESAHAERLTGCGKCKNGYIERGEPMSFHGFHSDPCPNPACSAARIALVSRAKLSRGPLG